MATTVAKTLAERVIETAESQLGRRERGGPNRGDCEPYQRLYGEFFVGKAWCGCFVGWVWSQVDPSWKALASPSTPIMASIAQTQGLVCPPAPGAAFVISPLHTGLLHHHLGGGIWKTIEGNSGDMVAFRQRSLEGTVVYAPPGVADGAPPPAAEVKWFFIEDPASKRLYGGWASRAGRDAACAKLEERLGRPLRRFRDPANQETPFFVEDPTEPPRFYGGWMTQAGRDRALSHLERGLGRELRPFSRMRPAAGPAPDADPLGKVD